MSKQMCVRLKFFFKSTRISYSTKNPKKYRAQKDDKAKKHFSRRPSGVLCEWCDDDKKKKKKKEKKNVGQKVRRGVKLLKNKTQDLIWLYTLWGVDGRLSWWWGRWQGTSGGVARRKKRERNWQRRPSRVVPRKLQGRGRGTCGGEEVGTQVHLTRTVVRACGRRINRCHHGDRTSVARRHGVIPRYDRPLRRPHLPPRSSVVRGVAVLYILHHPRSHNDPFAHTYWPTVKGPRHRCYLKDLAGD